MTLQKHIRGTLHKHIAGTDRNTNSNMMLGCGDLNHGSGPSFMECTYDVVAGDKVTRLHETGPWTLQTHKHIAGTLHKHIAGTLHKHIAGTLHKHIAGTLHKHIPVTLHKPVPTTLPPPDKRGTSHRALSGAHSPPPELPSSLHLHSQAEHTQIEATACLTIQYNIIIFVNISSSWRYIIPNKFHNYTKF